MVFLTHFSGPPSPHPLWKSCIHPCYLAFLLSPFLLTGDLKHLSFLFLPHSKYLCSCEFIIHWSGSFPKLYFILNNVQLYITLQSISFLCLFLPQTKNTSQFSSSHTTKYLSSWGVIIQWSRFLPKVLCNPLHDTIIFYKTVLKMNWNSITNFGVKYNKQAVNFPLDNFFLVMAYYNLSTFCFQ